mgnify:CR=1 FL=1
MIKIHGEILGINFRRAGEHSDFRLAIAANTVKEFLLTQLSWLAN